LENCSETTPQQKIISKENKKKHLYFVHISKWLTTNYRIPVVWGTIGGTGNSSQQQDLFNLMGSMYASVVFVGVNNSSSVQPVVAVERTVYYRERAAGMYSSFPYSFAQVIKTVIIRSLLISSFIY
jgi:hypothetical protein